MFDERGIERLSKWKEFRNSLETSERPFEDTIDLWNKAPFVFPFLNPLSSNTWPGPWELVMISRLDDLAIALGIMYTLKLTQRFMESEFEIHMSIREDRPNANRYFVVVNNRHVLNYEYGKVSIIEHIENFESEILHKASAYQ